MNITVVTPWLNCHELLPAYETVVSVLEQDDRLVVVDNASVPPIVVPSADETVRLKTNLGFSKACNRGLRRVQTDAVLFLNNDVVMTSPTWLHQIRSFLRPGVLIGPDLRVDNHCRVDGFLYPYLDGWCLGGMTAELRGFGGWDESLEEPSYYGDNVLSIRARQAGMKLVQVPVGLRHLGNYTTRRTDVSEVSARNRVIYERVARETRHVAA